MSLKYKVVARPLPGKPDDPYKHYAQPVRGKEIDVRKLCEDVGKISTISQIDLMAAIEAFIMQLPSYLADGEVLRLGEFGTFTMNLSSEGADTEEDFHAGLIRGTRVNFRPGKLLRKTFNDIEFEKVDG